MASSRIPGPIGFSQEIPGLNDETLVRARSPLPGVVGIAGALRLRQVLDSGQPAALAGGPIQTDEDRVIWTLQGKTKHFSLDREAFRLIRTAEWPDLRNDERYEIVDKEESLYVLETAAEQPTISPVEKTAFEEAASLLADTHVQLSDTGLLLLRKLRARFVKSASTEAPVTPSQLARMMAKDKQEEDHWIEIELLYDDGTCVANAKYLIVTPDKQEKTGVTNAYGRARVDGIPAAGQCKISFPDIDGNAWKKAQ